MRSERCTLGYGLYYLTVNSNAAVICEANNTRVKYDKEEKVFMLGTGEILGNFSRALEYFDGKATKNNFCVEY